MEKRILAKTDLEVPIVGFGASSLGQEFRSVTLTEAMESVKVALDHGMNLIDTADVYGFGKSESSFDTIMCFMGRVISR